MGRAASRISPTVARLQSKIVPLGSMVAELSRSPASVIVRSVVLRYFPRRAVMSVGVHHGIAPFQYADLVVDGVPPLTIEQTAPKRVATHGAVNPRSRVRPVTSSWI